MANTTVTILIRFKEGGKRRTVARRLRGKGGRGMSCSRCHGPLAECQCKLSPFWGVRLRDEPSRNRSPRLLQLASPAAVSQSCYG